MLLDAVRLAVHAVGRLVGFGHPLFIGFGQRVLGGVEAAFGLDVLAVQPMPPQQAPALLAPGPAIGQLGLGRDHGGVLDGPQLALQILKPLRRARLFLTKAAQLLVTALQGFLEFVDGLGQGQAQGRHGFEAPLPQPQTLQGGLAGAAQPLAVGQPTAQLLVQIPRLARCPHGQGQGRPVGLGAQGCQLGPAALQLPPQPGQGRPGLPDGLEHGLVPLGQGLDGPAPGQPWPQGLGLRHVQVGPDAAQQMCCLDLVGLAQPVEGRPVGKGLAVRAEALVQILDALGVNEDGHVGTKASQTLPDLPAPGLDRLKAHAQGPAPVLQLAPTLGKALGQDKNLTHFLKFFQKQATAAQKRQGPLQALQAVQLAAQLLPTGGQCVLLPFGLGQGLAVPLPVMPGQAGGPQLRLQLLVARQGGREGPGRGPGLEQLVRLVLQPLEHGPQRGEARPCGEEGLPHLAFLVEDALSAADQGFVVDAVHGGEHVLPHAVQKRGQRVGRQGAVGLVEKVVPGLLAPAESELQAVVAAQGPAHQELVVGMQKIVAGAQGEAEEEGQQAAQGAGLARLVGAVHDVQPGQGRIELQDPSGKGAESREFQALNPHGVPPAAGP